jgi:G3E family GTPase
LLWEGILPGITPSPKVSIHRIKGRILVEGGQEFILQGVRELYQYNPIEKSDAQESKIVLIGEGLREDEIKKSLQIYLGV